MFQANGYDVLYRNGAFKTVGSHKENPLIAPSGVRLRTALDQAIGATLDQGDGRWIITRKYSGYHRPAGIVAGLMVFVPRDSKERTLLLAAVDFFEQVAASYLGAPVDSMLREIEAEQHVCVVCGRHASRLRVTVRDQEVTDPTYLCGFHTRKLSELKPDPVQPIYSWENLNVHQIART